MYTTLTNYEYPDYTLERYSPVRVSIFRTSPVSTNSGTGHPLLRQIRRTDREDDRLHPAVLPYGRRISDERQRPQREVGLGIRPDGFGPLHGCGPTTGRAKQRGSLLERLRRHAVTRRHGAIRGQRLGRQGLHPHQFRRRSSRSLGSVRRHQPGCRTTSSLHARCA